MEDHQNIKHKQAEELSEGGRFWTGYNRYDYAV